MLTKEIINGKVKEIYTWPNPAFPFYYYLNHNKCRIFILENIFHNFLWLKEAKNYIRPTDYFFIVNGCFINRNIVQLAKFVLDYLNINKDQFIVMCNEFRELQYFLEEGFVNSILLNHNAWLDEKIYSILNTPKIYDALLIGRADKCKRLHLASQVKNLALVTGNVRYDSDITNTILPPHVNEDNKRLNVNEIVEIINKSKCGLCLSAEEGACYTSSEYLLCGIPVVSTFSMGGRDLWYNEDNSIVCSDNLIDIANSVEQIKSRKFDHEKIRSNHIKLSIYFRNIFIDQVDKIFKRHGVNDITSEKWFADHYINYMKHYSNNQEVISYLKG